LQTVTTEAYPTTPCIEIPEAVRIKSGRAKGYGWMWYTDGSGRRRNQYVHRRIAERMVGRTLERHEEVMHLCDNPPCFRGDHLVVGSHAENLRMAASRGMNQGERNGQAKLTTAEVAAIRSRSESARVLAAEYGVNASHIYKIRSGRRRAGA
jgi:hypothetical protein